MEEVLRTGNCELPHHNVMSNKLILVSYVAKLIQVAVTKSFLVSGGVCGDW